MLDLEKDYVLIVEDNLGQTYEDKIEQITRYGIEGNNFYQLTGEQFYVEYFNDFDRLKVDIPGDISIGTNSVSRYKIKEIWEISGTAMIKIYSNYKKI